jgi:transcriptional regulator with XRE-family HTH domain
MQTNLDQTVLTQLQARRGDWQGISKRAKVSYSWLSKFANGHIPNPGYATLTRLHTELNTLPNAAQVPAEPARAAIESVAGQGA